METTAIATVQSEMNNNGFLSTIKLDNENDKALFFNATSNPDYRLSDCINKTILVKDLFIEKIEMERKDKEGNLTGEIDLVPRIVLIDTEGKSYQAVSTGVYNALNRLCMVYGMPTWENGIPLTVVQVTRGMNKMLTVKVAA